MRFGQTWLEVEKEPLRLGNPFCHGQNLAGRSHHSAVRYSKRGPEKAIKTIPTPIRPTESLIGGEFGSVFEVRNSHGGLKAQDKVPVETPLSLRNSLSLFFKAFVAVFSFFFSSSRSSLTGKLLPRKTFGILLHFSFL